MNFVTVASNDALILRLRQLLSREERIVVQFVLHLAEVYERRLHLGLGYGSLFTFCREHLRMSNGTAGRRADAAFLLIRFPLAAERLRDGRISLSVFLALEEIMHEDTYQSILDRACRMTTDEVRVLVNELRPRVDPAPAPYYLATAAPTGDALEHPVAAASLPRTPGTADGPVASVAPDHLPPARRLPRLSIEQTESLAAKIRQARELLSFKVPDGDLTKIIDECLTQTIKYCLKRRRGGDDPRSRKETALSHPDGIPIEIKRQVWDRDGGACTFVGATGKRCGSRRAIEFHHIQPKGKEGPPTVENLTCYCRPHNRYQAEIDFGRAFVEKKVAEAKARKRARDAARAAKAASRPTTPATAPPKEPPPSTLPPDPTARNPRS